MVFVTYKIGGLPHPQSNHLGSRLINYGKLVKYESSEIVIETTTERVFALYDYMCEYLRNQNVHLFGYEGPSMMEGDLFMIFYKSNPMFNEDDLPTDWVDFETRWTPVKAIRATNPEDAYRKMQGENWSPNGEAKPLTRALDTHTSMSIGDVCINLRTGKAFGAIDIGFSDLPQVSVDREMNASEVEADLEKRHLQAIENRAQEYSDAQDQLIPDEFDIDPMDPCAGCPPTEAGCRDCSNDEPDQKEDLAEALGRKREESGSRHYNTPEEF